MCGGERYDWILSLPHKNLPQRTSLNNSKNKNCNSQLKIKKKTSNWFMSQEHGGKPSQYVHNLRVMHICQYLDRNLNKTRMIPFLGFRLK